MKKILLSLFIACTLGLVARGQITVTIQSHLLGLDGNPVPDGPLVLSLYTLSGLPEDTYGDGTAYTWNNASVTILIGQSFSYHSDAIEAGFSKLPNGNGFAAFGLDGSILQEALLSDNPGVMSGNLLANGYDILDFSTTGGMLIGDELFFWEPETYSVEGTFPQIPTSAVPEPSTYGLFGAAALAAVVVLRRRIRR
jgi:PEP-CTERM motif